MGTNIFPILLLAGRPASGKSEIVAFLRNISPEKRLSIFHLGEMDIFDDFPMLWAWFEEDALLRSKFQLPGLHTDERGYFLHREYWHLLIERLCLDYHKARRDKVNYDDSVTALIEFSRGSQHGGYREAFHHLTPEILQLTSILYVNVSYQESLRKNRRRFNRNRPDSILEHGLSDEKMDTLYKEDDWTDLAPEACGTIQLKDQQVPYAVFENEDDVTTNQPEQLTNRLESVLQQLWTLHQSR